MEGSASDEATGAPPGSGITRRQRAPTITVDTSAVSPPPQSEGLALQDLPSDHQRTQSVESAPYRSVHTPRHSRNTSSTDGLDSRPISPHNVSSPVSRTNEHNYLAVPDSRSRRNSAGSEDVSPTQVSFGGETVISPPHPSPAVDGVLANGNQKKEQPDFDPITADESVLQPDPGTEKSFEVADNKFAFSPGMLGKLYNPKSLAAFYALGGLTGIEMGLRTNIRAGLSMDETTFPDSVTFDEVKDTVRASQDSPDSSKDATLKPSTSDLAASRATAPDHFADRRRVFAENRLPVKKAKNIFQLAWIAYNDKVLILLSIAAVISLALGLYQTFGQPHPPGEPPVEWIEGVAIMAAIIIVVVVGAGNDWQKERQFAKLNRKKEDRTVKVIRSGHSQEINVHDLLVGDVMHLEPGDLVPVDGIFIEGSGVKCDESSATGESDIIKKHPAPVVYRAIEARQDTRKLDPFILSGSKVNEGMGTFLVTAVGVNSVYGKTMVSLHDEIEATPLQLKLNRLAEGIAKLGGASALLLFIVLFIKFLASLPGSRENASQKGQNFLQILIVSITVVVVAVPEGLPLAVTLALAFATMRMLRDNNLVRALQACETMGNATTVCSDKTGTLTQNKMTVVAGTIGASSSFGDKDLVSRTKTTESSSKVTESSYDQDAGNITPQALVGTLAPSVREVLRASIALNSSAFEGEQDGKPTFIGSKTETALLSFARDHLGMDTVRVERSNARVVQSVPFDSGRKCMATVVQLPDGTFRMYVKGASEIMLAKCSGIVPHPTKGLDTAPLSDEAERALNVMINAYASHSLRTIGLIYRDFQTWPPEGARSADDPQMADFDTVFQRMTFLCVVGIQDPLREGVRDAVRKCQMAGVFVRMVTGDNVVTARAIAEECGIFTQGGVIMEGPKFRRLNRAQMDRTIPRLQVLARSSPEDKRILVKRLKELGETVAVTGDGTNDAPALKTADVGFSMGIAGTEVAKEASSIILMDDNFASIVKAIMWGRAVNDAVKKFLQFQLTVNVTAVILTFVSSVSNANEESVLRATQLLWVNLIMDTFAALALATDPPAESVLQRKPDRKAAPLITVTMWKMILGQAVYQLAVTFILYFGAERIFSYNTNEEREKIGPFVFNTFVWMQIFNMINNRRLDNKFNIFENLYRNRFFMFIFLIMVGGQTLIMFVGGRALHVKPLNGAQWGYSVALGALSIPIGVVIRLIPDELVRRILPQWMQRKKTPQVVVTDEERPFEWNQALEGIREELFFLKKLRGGRLNAIKFRLQHPRQSLLPHGRSRSGSRSRSRSSSVPQTPTGEHSTEVLGSPTAAQTPESRTRRRTRSRSNSAFGPAAAMAGVVAGSVAAGWSPVGSHHGDRDMAKNDGEKAGGNDVISKAELEGQEGVIVHPATNPSDPVVRDDVRGPGGLPPSQKSETNPTLH